MSVPEVVVSIWAPVLLGVVPLVWLLVPARCRGPLAPPAPHRPGSGTTGRAAGRRQPAAGSRDGAQLARSGADGGNGLWN